MEYLFLRFGDSKNESHFLKKNTFRIFIFFKFKKITDTIIRNKVFFFWPFYTIKPQCELRAGCYTGEMHQSWCVCCVGIGCPIKIDLSFIPRGGLIPGSVSFSWLRWWSVRNLTLASAKNKSILTNK